MRNEVQERDEEIAPNDETIRELQTENQNLIQQVKEVYKCIKYVLDFCLYI